MIHLYLYLTTAAVGVAVFSAIAGMAMVFHKPEAVNHRRRSNPRLRTRSSWHLMWSDASGEIVKARSSSLDISDCGACFVHDEPISPGTLVFFDDLTYKVSGRGRIRSCNPAGWRKYRMGLEFQGRLVEMP